MRRPPSRPFEAAEARPEATFDYTSQAAGAPESEAFVEPSSAPYEPPNDLPAPEMATAEVAAPEVAASDAVIDVVSEPVWIPYVPAPEAHAPEVAPAPPEPQALEPVIVAPPIAEPVDPEPPVVLLRRRSRSKWSRPPHCCPQSQ